MKLSTGTVNVCFSTSDALISRVIRWFTRSKVSHCFVTFYDETLDKVFVMQAADGFQVVPWRRWIKHNRVVARYALRAPEWRQLRALRRLSEYLGTEYDTLSLLGFLSRRWRKRLRNPLSSADKLICSEAVAIYLRDVGFPQVGAPDSYVPADLWELLHDHPDAAVPAETPTEARPR